MIDDKMIQQEVSSEITRKLEKSILDLNQEVKRPPTILCIKQSMGEKTIFKRILTAGNISTITGQAKSRKTFLLTLFSASIQTGGDISSTLYSDYNEPGKDMIAYVDTEQSTYDSFITMKRIVRLGAPQNLFIPVNLRPETPADRLLIFQELFAQFGDRLKFVVLDGIADLSSEGVNDEKEAIRLVNLLMRLSDEHQCHICCVLHYNKEGKVNGHIGSQIMRKSEIIISLTKNGESSDVACDMSRGMDFEPFVMSIDDGLPFIDFGFKPLKTIPVSRPADVIPAGQVDAPF